ncbi:hypothetical protein OG909_18690 [Streptomyces sp. NBC_01754]|uniref:hypothetical protein n=1 Tax=Streptomyces sp. NBC_01754 TaxID=2975930 RepID=UPI002DDB8F3B|nr:hypothetical protein [Streptomyces sp. NBC_01754]WSC94129.1 hypothetical protein OG909_18690 [Streptomyces sp. NBC_01754]
METDTHTTAGARRLAHPRTRRSFATAKALVVAYGVLGVAVLATVTVLAATGHTVTSFMWGRSAGVLASAAVTYRLTVLTSRGSRSAHLRVRVISVVTPVAIIAVDVLPGTLPWWFVLVQGVCALAVAAAAFALNGSRPRTAFPRAR